MSIQSDLAGIKAVEDTLTANRVANFAYTNTAYENNDANGVSEYNVENEQNIPVGTASVMKVNATVIARGFRAQASSVTRMLLNHFLGRLSYNLNKVNDNMSSLLVKLNANLGVADGLATLGSDGRLTPAQNPQLLVDINASIGQADGLATLGSDGRLTPAQNPQLLVDINASRGQADGLATLGSDGRLTPAQNPQLLVDINASIGQADGLATLGSDGRLLYAQRPFCESFTYIVDSNASLQAWLSNTSGNDYTCILIKSGTWTYSSATEPISLTTIGTKRVVGETGSLLRIASNIQTFLHYDSNSIDPLTISVPQIEGVHIQTNGTTIMLNNCIGVHNSRAYATNSSFTSLKVNGIWVACSDSDSGLYYSTDGMAWTRSNITSGHFQAVYNADGIWVACSFSGSGLYYSTNGMAWTQSNITSGHFQTVYNADGIWVAGANSGLYYSTNGMAWTQSNITSGGFRCVYYANGIWVACSDSGLYYSTDGMTWSRSNITSGSFYAVYNAVASQLSGCRDVHNCILAQGTDCTADFAGKAVNSIADTAEGGFNYIIN